MLSFFPVIWVFFTSIKFHGDFYSQVFNFVRFFIIAKKQEIKYHKVVTFKLNNSLHTGTFQINFCNLIYMDTLWNTVRAVLDVNCLQLSLGKKSAFHDAGFLQKNVWGTSLKIPYLWRDTVHIWVVLLVGRATRKICFNQSG